VTSIAVAQKIAKTLRIAFVGSGSFAASGHYTTSFGEALRTFGYTEDRNIEIEYRWVDGKFDLLPNLINDVMAHKPDVIVSFGGPQLTTALKSATSTVPVVFLTGDPVAEGIVASLSRPDGNLTGVAVLGMELDAKRLELIKEALPHATRIAVLRNPDKPRAKDQLENVMAAAKAIDLEVALGEARSGDELESAFSALSRAEPDALLVLSDPMLNAQHARIVDFAVSNHLPGFYFWRQFVELGGFISYGASLDEQPTRFELVINLRTARALGITLPSSLLNRADEVIE
jgi:putative tryptophan/tyrosine transport system substrate-binding protein